MSKKINISLPKEQRLGQIGINNQGEKMTIIIYRNANDIDIQFEDGSIMEHKAYNNFLKGGINHPIRYEESFAYYIEVELGLDINKVWNFEKNTVNPYKIYKNRKEKVFILCQEKDYHNDEGGYLISCSEFYRGSRCSYCKKQHKIHKLDSLGYLYPQIAQMIIDDERNNITMKDTYKIAPHSDKKFYFKCDKCKIGSKNKKFLRDITRRGYSCEFCSDGVSIPEKFIVNIFKQLNIEFIIQLNKSTFKWCQSYKYDFYIPSLNMIIETHGRQHYEKGFESCNGRTLEKEQENDNIKKELALKNNINNYIVIDCRYSEFDWLKNNSIKELNNYFDLSNVNWELAWEKSQNSLVWEVKRLYDLGYNNMEIIEELNISITTIEKYKKILKIKTQSEIKQENILKTKELIEQGKTNIQIAKVLGVNRKAIEEYKKQLKIKTQYEIKQENLLRTKELVQQGKSTKEIAEILGISVSTVRSYKKEL